MIRLDQFQKYNFDTPSLIFFDWALAAASLGWGVYQQSTLWIIAGLIGAVASWWRPLTRVQMMLAGIIKNKISL